MAIGRKFTTVIELLRLCFGAIDVGDRRRELDALVDF
jgi:hypothetical protein